MDAVIKVGGSLAEVPGALKSLGISLARAAKKHQLVIVPGGGKFADIVRQHDATFNLPATLSHRLAIQAMDQYGHLLSYFIPQNLATDSLQYAQESSTQGKAVVFLPSKLMLKENPFEASWDVTSDSITAYIAIKLSAPKLILATDVDGVLTQDPKQHQDVRLYREVTAHQLLKIGKRTSVDMFLPKYLSQVQLECYVVNGVYPDRIERILENQETICTRIVP